MNKLYGTLPCVTCGKPMPQTAVPAARAWCSDECYKKWEEERPKTSGDMGDPMLCIHGVYIKERCAECDDPSERSDN